MTCGLLASPVPSSNACAHYLFFTPFKKLSMMLSLQSKEDFKIVYPEDKMSITHTRCHKQILNTPLRVVLFTEVTNPHPFN